MFRSSYSPNNRSPLRDTLSASHWAAASSGAAHAPQFPSWHDSDFRDACDQVQLIGGKLVRVIPHTQESEPSAAPGTSEIPILNKSTTAKDRVIAESQHSDRHFAAYVSSSPKPTSLDRSSGESDVIHLSLARPSTKDTSNPDGRACTPKNMPTAQERRRSKWPTAADFRKRQTTYANEKAVSSQSNVPSDAADPGDGTNIRAKAHIHDDRPPADWDGSWAQPPMDWDDRPDFVDPKIPDRILEWQKNDGESAAQHTVIDSICEGLGEIAPYSWFTANIDGLPADVWWVNHLKDPDVPSDSSPWWRRYATSQTPHLSMLEHPHAHLDPEDSDTNKVMTSTSTQALLAWDNKQLRTKNQAIRKRQEQKATPINYIPVVPDVNPHAPRINIYLRPAEKKDVPQMTGIYEYWITHGISCPEMNTLSNREVADRLENIQEDKLPFIVAVHRSAKVNNRRRGQALGSVPQTSTDDKVVGFAFADDFNDIRGMYRYTVEVELFVDPAFTRNGVGRCMLDKILSVLDQNYSHLGGYEFASDDLAYSFGGKRYVGSVILNMPYGQGEWDATKWQLKWLENFGFKKVGELAEIGRKHSTIVNLVILQKQTSETIKPYAI